MIQYVVGQRFPHEKYLNRGNLTVAIVNDAFFDILVIFENITPQERKVFRTGKLTMSLFRYKDVPFVVTDFGDGFNFDISIDITKLDEEQQEKWLNERSNIVNLYLVDAYTGTLEAMRVLGVNFSEELKDICEVQSGHSPEYVKNAIGQALELIDIPTMIANAVKKITFK